MYFRGSWFKFSRISMSSSIFPTCHRDNELPDHRSCSFDQAANQKSTKRKKRVALNALPWPRREETREQTGAGLTLSPSRRRARYVGTLFPRCLRNPCSITMPVSINSVRISRTETETVGHCNGGGGCRYTLACLDTTTLDYAPADGRSLVLYHGGTCRSQWHRVTPAFSFSPSSSEIGVVINRHGLSPLRTHAHPTLQNTEGKQEKQCQKAFIPDSLSDTARVSPFLYPSRCGRFSRCTRVSWACLPLTRVPVDRRAVLAFIAAGN